jgi:(p)ppGpp synthase/HD superfamily hydrolase
VKRFDLNAAIALAEQVHRGATDKAGRPYIEHVTRVVDAVYTNAEKMAAALHDVVEDTSVTLDDLTDAGCPAEVITAVDALTRRPDEAYDSFLARVGQNELARRVKIADLIDNSDERRLELLSADEADRLRAKYANAIAALGATQEVLDWRERRRLDSELPE